MVHSLRAILLALPLAAFFAQSVFASNAAVSPQSGRGMPAPVDVVQTQLKSKSRHDCGLSCQYSQANNVLSVQGTYNARRTDYLTGIATQLLSNLTSARANAQGKSMDSTLDQQSGEIFAAIGDYCLDSEQQGSSQDKADGAIGCFNRYRALQAKMIFELSEAQTKNRANRDLLKTAPYAIAQVDAVAVEREAQVPLVPEFKDLTLHGRGVDPTQPKPILGADLAKELTVEPRQKPKKDDFYAYEIIPRYPGTSSQEKLVRVKQVNGAFVLDTARYQQALRIYCATVQAAKPDPDCKAFANDLQHGAALRILAHDRKAKKVHPNSTERHLKDSLQNRDQEYQWYEEARQDVIQVANRRMGQVASKKPATKAAAAPGTRAAQATPPATSQANPAGVDAAVKDPTQAGGGRNTASQNPSQKLYQPKPSIEPGTMVDLYLETKLDSANGKTPGMIEQTVESYLNSIQ